MTSETTTSSVSTEHLPKGNSNSLEGPSNRGPHRRNRARHQPVTSDKASEQCQLPQDNTTKPHKPRTRRKLNPQKSTQESGQSSESTQAAPTQTASTSSGPDTTASKPQPKGKAPKDEQQNQAPRSKPNASASRGRKEPNKGNSNGSSSDNNVKNAVHRPLFTKNRAQGKLTDPVEEETDKTSKAARRNKGRTNGKSVVHTESHDLRVSLIAGLKSSTYECMVCWDVVRPGHQTWSCDCCWAVFHLACLRKWAEKSLEDTSSNRPITGWRCPGCQHMRNAIPKDYLCFCGKQQKPDINHYLTPHTCGQLCKRDRKCPHPCNQPCHPGPCPPCEAMGPIVYCFCGSHSRQARCVDTDYTTRGYSCENECGELLGCQKHTCKDKCHAGICVTCPIQETQTCYCGKTSRQAACGTGTAVKNEYGDSAFYSCEKVCDKLLPCGEHKCTKLCHADPHDRLCPFDPSNIKTCPCGSTKISATDRTKCTDPVPTCESICGKSFACGHTCAAQCHLGECPPCCGTIETACRCQTSTVTLKCIDMFYVHNSKPPLCDKICRVTRNCGRHQCGARCCPAMKHRGGKKPLVPDSAHDCMETCDRMLSCGLHRCKARCHKGLCAPCLEVTMDELICHCGNTRLQPPVRCGTKIPACSQPCIRPTACGHIRTLRHNCHPDDEPCPPCAVLVVRKCVCGKTDLRNIPCYRESPHCGKMCEKPLACGHQCMKTCHDGPCLPEGEVCHQTCKRRRRCGHPCAVKCHGDGSCPVDSVCEAPIRVSCSCGNNTLQVPCGAKGDSITPVRQLSCNDFCAKLERNKKLAAAFDINREKTTALSTADLNYYDDTLCSFYSMYPGWCKQMETSIVEFVKSSKQTMHCKPAKSEFRKFIHRYCMHFNVATEAVDEEPFRSVILRKSQGQCRIPSVLLSRAVHDTKLNRPSTATAALTEASAVRKKHAVNALCLSGLSFGLLEFELDQELKTIFEDVKYTSQWLTDSDAVVVVPIVSPSMMVDDKEQLVWHLKKKTQAVLEKSGSASRVDCCWIDQHGKMTWAESVGTIDNGATPRPASNKSQGPSLNNKFEALSIHDHTDGHDTHERLQVSPKTAPADLDNPISTESPATAKY